LQAIFSLRDQDALAPACAPRRCRGRRRRAGR
jgi:hypothetical protein